jgi:hypothetical protein
MRTLFSSKFGRQVGPARRRTLLAQKSSAGDSEIEVSPSVTLKMTRTKCLQVYQGKLIL